MARSSAEAPPHFHNISTDEQPPALADLAGEYVEVCKELLDGFAVYEPTFKPESGGFLRIHASSTAEIKGTHLGWGRLAVQPQAQSRFSSSALALVFLEGAKEFGWDSDSSWLDDGGLYGEGLGMWRVNEASNISVDLQGDNDGRVFRCEVGDVLVARHLHLRGNVLSLFRKKDGGVASSSSAAAVSSSAAAGGERREGGSPALNPNKRASEKKAPPRSDKKPRMTSASGGGGAAAAGSSAGGEIVTIEGLRAKWLQSGEISSHWIGSKRNKATVVRRALRDHGGFKVRDKHGQLVVKKLRMSWQWFKSDSDEISKCECDVGVLCTVWHSVDGPAIQPPAAAAPPPAAQLIAIKQEKIDTHSAKRASELQCIAKWFLNGAPEAAAAAAAAVAPGEADAAASSSTAAAVSSWPQYAPSERLLRLLDELRRGVGGAALKRSIAEELMSIVGGQEARCPVGLEIPDQTFEGEEGEEERGEARLVRPNALVGVRVVEAEGPLVGQFEAYARRTIEKGEKVPFSGHVFPDGSESAKDRFGYSFTLKKRTRRKGARNVPRLVLSPHPCVAAGYVNDPVGRLEPGDERDRRAALQNVEFAELPGISGRAGVKRVVLRATRKIQLGETLWCQYGEVYWPDEAKVDYTTYEGEGSAAAERSSAFIWRLLQAIQGSSAAAPVPLHEDD